MATIREQIIKTLYEKWAEIKCRKNEITNEMWKLEQIEDHIKNTLKSYGNHLVHSHKILLLKNVYFLAE